MFKGKEVIINSNVSTISNPSKTFDAKQPTKTYEYSQVTEAIKKLYDNNFYDVVDRVSILTSDKDKNTVTLETDGNNLIMKSSSAEIGRVEEKMTITKDQEIDVKVSFSSKYMMDALKSFNTETVELYFVGEIKPILLKSDEDESLTQLVLPIRTY